MEPDMLVNFDTLHTALIRKEFEIQEDIKELKETPTDELNITTLGQVNKETKDKITLLSRDIKLLKEANEKQKEKDIKKVQKEKIARHKTEYQSLLASLRKAVMQCQAGVKANQEKERLLLLENSQEALRRRRAKIQKDHYKTAREITESLSRSRRLMSDEVERSGAILDALESSSNTLTKDVVKSHEDYESALDTGSHILNIMKRRDWTDWLLIMAATALFFLVVLYILKSRMMNAASPLFGAFGYIQWALSLLFFWV